MTTYPYIKIIFRLVSPNATPLAFANISAELFSKTTRSSFLNTMLPEPIKSKTNSYGIASMILTANDHLTINDSQYLITISYNGNSYYFLVKLSKDTPNVVDFEELLGREGQNLLNQCKNTKEGDYKIQGQKFYL